jgi:hypothetical protein
MGSRLSQIVTDVFSTLFPPRTPGPLGRHDAADPNVPAKPGDTPGSTGRNDHARVTAHAAPEPFPPSRLREFGTAEQTAFKRKVYDEQLKMTRHSSKDGKQREFFAGLPLSEMEVVEAGHTLRKDAATACRALLAQARADLAGLRKKPDEQASKVASIGIASAYRDPEGDLKAWEAAFATSYNKTKPLRKTVRGGEHGDLAARDLARRMLPVKAIPGFSNHTSGIAVDFATTEGHETLGPKTSQRESWRKSWLYAWLRANADRYKFTQLPSEEWHWDYKG